MVKYVQWITQPVLSTQLASGVIIEIFGGLNFGHFRIIPEYLISSSWSMHVLIACSTHLFCKDSETSDKDIPKEDKPSNKGQAESTLVYTLYRKSSLKEDNLSTKDKMAGPEGVLY